VRCLRPMAASRCPETGEVWIGSDPTRSGRSMQLPCGKCIGCRLDRARAWSVRIVHEAKLYRSNWFATFTYRDEDLPASRSLEYPDFQAMMKRLRKRYRGVSRAPDGRYPIRFFAAGEYGERYARPHWHCVLFNCRFGDEVRYLNGTYRSAALEGLWGKGQAVIGAVTPQSAAYVAGYTLGKVFGRAAEDHYEDVVTVDLATGEYVGRRPEFCVMSRRPGIGSWWYERFGGDLFPHDFAVSSSGKRGKVPRYYWERFRNEADGDLVEGIEVARYERSKVVSREDLTPDRLAVREEAVRNAERNLRPHKL